jgi:hypothetical protein
MSRKLFIGDPPPDLTDPTTAVTPATGTGIVLFHHPSLALPRLPYFQEVGTLDLDQRVTLDLENPVVIAPVKAP